MSTFFTYSKPLERLFREHGEPATYAKGQHLVWQKDKSDWVFFLREGLVRASASFTTQPDRIIGFFVPGIVFAQSGSFIAQNDEMLSYIAEAPSSVYRMRRRTFLTRIRENPGILQEYLAMTLRNQIYLIDRIVYQGEKSLYRKCVRWLLFMAKYYGAPNGNRCVITVPLTQETAANFLHTTRESLNGTLRQLSEEGLIEVSTKRITLRSASKLRALLK